MGYPLPLPRADHSVLCRFANVGPEILVRFVVIPVVADDLYPLVDVLNNLFEADKDSEQFGEYVGLIYEQALLTEGSQLKDPLGFAKKVSELMVKAQKA